MKEEDQDLLILSEYLNGELNEKDSQALEDRLDKEPHLLALFLELNEIQMASIEAAEPGLRNMVAQASDEFHQSAKPAKAPWLKWMAVAAGILY